MVDGGGQEPNPEDAESAEHAAPQAAPAPPPARGNVVAGYAVATLSIVLATIAVVAMIASFGGDGESDSGAVEAEPAGGILAPDDERDEPEHDEPDLLPGGGLFKIPEDVESVAAGARAAGCELRNFKVKSRDHVTEADGPVHYSSSPPTSGEHHPVPAPDGAYSESPDVEQLVHTLEHSRVIIWFERDLPARARAALKAYYDHDSALMVLVPDTTGMEYEVAATAWTREPGKHGTGRLLGCRDYSPDVYTALEAFKERNRGRGMELVP
jgi:Protein of unknown function (DUF3105)